MQDPFFVAGLFGGAKWAIFAGLIAGDLIAMGDLKAAMGDVWIQLAKGFFVARIGRQNSVVG